MAFLSAILIVSLALLQMSFASTASLNSFRSERVLRYSGDAALQAGINYLQKNPNKAQKGTDFVTGSANTSGTMLIPVEDNPSGANVPRAVTAGSNLQVEWEVPADVTSSGEKDDDGGQKPREVILTVSCTVPSSTSTGAHALLTCNPGSGGTKRIIAQARVRYEIDYGINPASTVTPQEPYPAGSRAVVPKIVWWSSKGN